MLDSVPSSSRDVVPFGGSRRRSAIRVFRPRSEEELQEVARALYCRGLCSSSLGAGLSFDGQGLPHDAAIEMAGLRDLTIDLERRRLKVGAGVLTGEALRFAVAHGFVLPVLPSSSHISVGGSISSNAYSRMTPGFGRESRSVLSIRLVTATGELRECSRDENSDLFYAAIGGFGLLGYITQVEYQLEHVGPHPAFESRAFAFDACAGLEYLIPGNRPEGLVQNSNWPGAGAVIMHHDGRIRTMLSRHRYLSTEERRTTVAHRDGPLRLGIELAVRRWPRLASRLWASNWVPDSPPRFVDDVADATFFMDGHLRAHRLSQRWGRRPTVMQQSFVLPCDSPQGDESAVSAFVEEIVRRLQVDQLHPAMLDVGYLPRGEQFSFCNTEENAFLVSLAFLAGRGRHSTESVAAFLRKMTVTCRSEYGGMVHLTKQAHCEDASLRHDHADSVRRIRSLRASHDPDGLIRTPLGERLGV